MKNLGDVNVQDASEAAINPALGAECDALHVAEREAVHVVGYLQSHLGLGEAARNTVAALQGADVDVVLHDISKFVGSPRGAYNLVSSNRKAVDSKVALIGCDIGELPGLLPHFSRNVRDAYRVGCWYWETPDFPDKWRDRFDLVDEVWATTSFMAESFRKKATVPVVVVPPMVAPPSVKADRAWLKMLVPELQDDEFVFLFQFDACSVPSRKNPDGVIKAFCQAFRSNEPVRLVIKVLNSARAPGLMEELHGIAEAQRISIFDARLESLDRFRLLASVNSFVSLHRAEGLGLSILEAMAYRLPVVATAWSGNMDFTTEVNAALVSYDLRQTLEDHGPYPAGTIWAEPRLDHAAEQMRRIWTDKAWARSLGDAAAATIATQCSAAATGAAMRARLQHIATLLKSTETESTPAVSGLQRFRTDSQLLRVFIMVMRSPWHYLSVLPKLPKMLWDHGLTGVFYRATLIAALKTPEEQRDAERRSSDGH